jgi:hypothetical protein
MRVGEDISMVMLINRLLDDMGDLRYFDRFPNDAREWLTVMENDFW